MSLLLPFAGLGILVALFATEIIYQRRKARRERFRASVPYQILALEFSLLAQTIGEQLTPALEKAGAAMQDFANAWRRAVQ